VQTDLDLGPPPGVYRAKIDDDFSFQYVGLFGPLLIRPAGGAAWMLKSVRAGGVDITDTPTKFGTRDQSLADVEVILTNRGPGVSGMRVIIRTQDPDASVYARLYAGSGVTALVLSNHTNASNCRGKIAVE